MTNVIALSLHDNRITDPAVEAYYAVENALDAAETAGTIATYAKLDRAYHEMADAIPLTRDGLRRKIEMNGRFASCLCIGECEDGALLSEDFEDLLIRNAETLEQGFDTIRA